MDNLSATLQAKHDRLLDTLRSYGSCAVAYSGGVDSGVVAQAAQLALGERAVAVTGVSASLADGELEAAASLAQRIGIRHERLDTSEFANPSYVANARDRCFHCKTELYTQLQSVVQRLGVAVVVNGTNADDLDDYRPGLRAAEEHHVRSPLVDCGITKAEVRELAAAWGLPVAEKPASPCLSSRVAYGETIIPERLRMIDRAEQLVRSLGIHVCRVRYLPGDVARVEVPRDFIPLVSNEMNQRSLENSLFELGFREVTIDPAGFRSGSLNDPVVVPLTTIAAPASR